MEVKATRKRGAEHTTYHIWEAKDEEMKESFTRLVIACYSPTEMRLHVNDAAMATTKLLIFVKKKNIYYTVGNVVY